MPINKRTAYRRKRIVRKRPSALAIWFKQSGHTVPWKKIGLGFSSILVGMLVFKLIMLLTTPVTFTCETQFGSCSKELNEKIAVHIDDSYLFTRRQILAIPNVHREIETLTSHLGLNRKLKVDVQVQKPEVAVTSATLLAHSVYFPTSFLGNVVSQTTETNLPILFLPSVESVPGQSLTEMQIKAVQIVHFLHKLEYEFQATIDQDTILQVNIHTPQPMQIIFPLDDANRDAETLVSTLQLILTQTKMNLDQVQIDLRFPKPIIRGGTENAQ